MRQALNRIPGVWTAAGSWFVCACLALSCAPSDAHAQFALGIAIGIPHPVAVVQAAPPPGPGFVYAWSYRAWHGDYPRFVSAVSGASGLDEREKMLQSYADYNRHVDFAQSNGACVADVAAENRGADGRLMWSAVSEGPFFFARLPRGQYLVTADYDGKAATRRIEVGSAPGPMHQFHGKAASQ